MVKDFIIFYFVVMRGNKDNSDQSSVSNHHQQQHHQQGHVPHYSYNPSGHHNQYNNSRMSSADKENPRSTRGGGGGRGGSRGGMRGSGPRGGPGGPQDDYGAMQTNPSNSGPASGTGNRGTGLLGGPPTHYHRGHQSGYSSGGGQRGAGGGHSGGERGHHNHNHSGQENIGGHQAGSNRGGTATNAAATTTEVKQPPPEFNMKTNDFPALPGVSPPAVGGVPSVGKHKTAAALTAEQEEQRAAFLEVVKGTGKIKLDSESGDNPAGDVDQHTPAAEDSSSHSEANNHR